MSLVCEIFNSRINQVMNGINKDYSVRITNEKPVSLTTMADVYEEDSNKLYAGIKIYNTENSKALYSISLDIDLDERVIEVLRFNIYDNSEVNAQFLSDLIKKIAFESEVKEIVAYDNVANKMKFFHKEDGMIAHPIKPKYVQGELFPGTIA